jgi:hypothetical protein
LSFLIEKELAQTGGEKVRLKAVIEELERRLSVERRDSTRLQELSVYCERVRNKLAGSGFDQKRFALEALKVQVIVDGRDWKLTYGFEALQREEQFRKQCQDIRSGIQ